ncbi:MAG: thioredoxin family protein [Defluviitaleaceae bacterium]|nr:thioredoxin family protein [Defluviitaleaceae bacterium]
MIEMLAQADFETEVTQVADMPVLVNFSATWCPPCKLLAPILAEISEELGDKIKFLKVDTDENKDLVKQFGIRGVPTMLMFKGGEMVERIAFEGEKDDLKAKIASFA